MYSSESTGQQVPQPAQKKGHTLAALLRWRFFPQFLLAVVVLLLIVAVALGLRSRFSTDGKTAKLGFEDIGELATQTAYCTEVQVTEDSRELFGMTIPFTQSKYIYSYDVVIKAGMDFSAVTWEVQSDTIQVKLPEMRILSSEIDPASLKVYHEDESVFQRIKLEENNSALIELRGRAETNAVDNGLLEQARTNAETILIAFFANSYDMETYSIAFTD